jgi:hypothetical protein
MRKEDSLFPMPSFRDRRKENYRGSARIAADQKLIDDFCSIRVHPQNSAAKVSFGVRLPSENNSLSLIIFLARRRTFRLARACNAVYAEKAKARTFADVSPRAWASTRHNCMRACSQLMER